MTQKHYKVVGFKNVEQVSYKRQSHFGNIDAAPKQYVFSIRLLGVKKIANLEQLAVLPIY